MAVASWSRCGTMTASASGRQSPDEPAGCAPGPPPFTFPADGGSVVRDGDERCFRAALRVRRRDQLHVTVGRCDRSRPRPSETGPPGHDRECSRSCPARPRCLAQLLAVLRVLLGADGRGARDGARPAPRRRRGADGRGPSCPSSTSCGTATRRRLTVLLDPARIKAGPGRAPPDRLPPARRASFRVLVGGGFRAPGASRSGAGANRRYAVGGDERRRVEPEGWRLTIPPSRTVDPLVVEFDRPLDSALLARCLHVAGPDGRRVDGTPELGPEERSWRLVPRRRGRPEVQAPGRSRPGGPGRQLGQAACSTATSPGARTTRRGTARSPWPSGCAEARGRADRHARR